MNRKFALIGYPLGHSLSPQIHSRLFKLDGKPFEYTLDEIPPESLADNFKKLRRLDGFNITIPHKIAIIPMCDRLDKTAERYGTINCIWNKDGEAIGYNTDVIGFTKSIAQLGTSLCGDVVILGCGGVGRMMALETLYSGGRLTLAVRKEDIEIAKGIKADGERLVSGASVRITTLDSLSGEFDLLVNATPVGMYPKVDSMPVSEEALGGVRHVFDAIYNPRRTKLLQTAEKLNIPASGGMAMLVLQAVAAHEIWDGAHYTDEDIKALISDMEELV